MAFIFFNIYLILILAITFCLDHVEVLKSINKGQPTAKNTFCLIVSFVLIVSSIAFTATISADA